MTLIQAMDMFPSEAAAIGWFEAQVWGGHRCGDHCGGDEHARASERQAHALLVPRLQILLQRPHRHRHRPTNVPLRKWAVAEYVRGQAHTNGVESFWSMIKRAHTGTFHKMSPKHLNRYVREFAGKHNIRSEDTIDQMRAVVAGLVGRNLLYRELISDNGLDSGAR